MKFYGQGRIKVPRFKESEGFYTTTPRSDLMKKIKSVETTPEIRFRKILWAIGLRYRKNVKSLPGKPDIVLRKYGLVIFIDGEFWHGFKWEEKKLKIKTNRNFWIPKIERNIQRDEEINHQLAEMGFKVIRFWGHQVKDDLNWCLNRVLENISDDDFEN